MVVACSYNSLHNRHVVIISVDHQGQPFFLISQKSGLSTWDDLKQLDSLVESVPVIKSASNIRQENVLDQAWLDSPTTIILILPAYQVGQFDTDGRIDSNVSGEFSNDIFPVEFWGLTGDYFLIKSDGDSAADCEKVTLLQWRQQIFILDWFKAWFFEMVDNLSNVLKQFGLGFRLYFKRLNDWKQT